jgi:hypothetical protein
VSSGTHQIVAVREAFAATSEELEAALAADDGSAPHDLLRLLFDVNAFVKRKPKGGLRRGDKRGRDGVPIRLGGMRADMEASRSECAAASVGGLPALAAPLWDGPLCMPCWALCWVALWGGKAWPGLACVRACACMPACLSNDLLALHSSG